MKKLLTTLTLLLLTATLSACGTTNAATPTLPPPPTQPPAEPTSAPPTNTPLPEPGEIVLQVDAELTEETCAGFTPILGGEVSVMVSTADGTEAGIGKVEFYIEDILVLTATEPPFGFTADLNEYADDTEFTLRVDVYDLSGNLHHSESNPVKVDNTPEPSLKALAEEAGIEFGSSFSGASDPDDETYDVPYLEVLCRDYNNIYLPMDWSWHEKRGDWYFGYEDRVIEFAAANNISVLGGPPIWGLWRDEPVELGDWSPTPRWVHEGDFSREEMIEIMYEAIEAQLAHYEGTIDEWLVVHEPFGGFEGPGSMTLKTNVWTEKLGEDHVELAYKYARQIAPDAFLILDEGGVNFPDQWGNYRLESFYLYVADLLERGTPIDGVGFQFHLTIANEWRDDPTVAEIVNNFARFGELGLEVYITNMDVQIEEPVTQEEIEHQAKLYAIALQACLESEYCTHFAVVGHSDTYSWIPEWHPGFSSANLFDEDMQPKPAYFALIEVLETYLGK